MKAFNNKILLTAFGLLISAALFAQKRNEFTLQQAVDFAMQNSIQVRNAMLDTKIQEQVNKEVTAMAYPQVSGSVQVMDYLQIPTSLIPAEFFGGTPGTFQPVQFGTKYNSTGSIDVSQILFDGQVFVGLQARRATLNFANKQTEITKEEIKVNVQKIYYQLVVGKQQVSSIEANADRIEKLLNDTKEIYKNGFAERLDVDKVTVSLTNLRTEKLKLENQLLAGNAALKFLLNMPQKDVLVLTDSITEEMLKENILDSAFNYNDRKELQLLEVARELGNYNVRRYKLSYIPTLAAFASYQKNAQRSKFDFFNDGAWFTTSVVGLKLQVPLFDGFAKKSKVAKAKLELQKTENNIEQMKAVVDNDVEQARIKIKSALLTMDAQKQNMELAEKVYNTTKLKYEQGLGSNQEIYNAQTELKVAQNSYYGSLYDAVIARIDYLKAIGKL